jgi:hypothetical protein
MKSFNSIKGFLRTLPLEERRELEWSIDTLMVQYWEVLRAESNEGKDFGGITIPVKDHYLTIALNLEWKDLRLQASVREVKLLDNYELACRNSESH